jgi:acyl-CoA thioesterase I
MNLRVCLTFLFCFVTLPMSAQQSLRYVALGDSYTIGTGVTPEESWPAIITKRLQKQKIPLDLIANLGINGWTTQDVIFGELPQFKKLKPDVATLLIGTNDWVQNVPESIFRQNLRTILDEMLKVIPNKNHILIVTVPDFSVTPLGKEYSSGRDIAKGLAAFNRIIKQEAKARALKVVDIYPLSKKFDKDESCIAKDGLHPSAKGYAKWADLIEPVFQNMLK